MSFCGWCKYLGRACNEFNLRRHEAAFPLAVAVNHDESKFKLRCEGHGREIRAVELVASHCCKWPLQKSFRIE